MFVIIYCDTELKRNMVVTLLDENGIALTEKLATYYDMKAEKYAITIHPHEHTTNIDRLNRFLNLAIHVKLIAAFHKVQKENKE